ncbi:hypothetical protein PPERSA_07925 [Pseudocohnilembus persalinus]|uniref:Uncharacterized protein n=1 Tax=Pseudocohnilembus persalinus TaxID=266149 RepID=A0A0V0QWB1_PSEPJ|nr:hypothetical protein PPERSA_07925 [Pseudocohnilembus persalinus]|eukprot:KRX06691.1 hypothetical protein PPERSA_07925 [Pseudocohnilembus persalinus]
MKYQKNSQLNNQQTYDNFVEKKYQKIINKEQQSTLNDIIITKGVDYKDQQKIRELSQIKNNIIIEQINNNTSQCNSRGPSNNRKKEDTIAQSKYSQQLQFNSYQNFNKQTHYHENQDDSNQNYTLNSMKKQKSKQIIQNIPQKDFKEFKDEIHKKFIQTNKQNPIQQKNQIQSGKNDFQNDISQESTTNTLQYSERNQSKDYQKQTEQIKKITLNLNFSSTQNSKRAFNFDRKQISSTNESLQGITGKTQKSLNHIIDNCIQKEEKENEKIKIKKNIQESEKQQYLSLEANKQKNILNKILGNKKNNSIEVSEKGQKKSQFEGKYFFRSHQKMNKNLESELNKSQSHLNSNQSQYQQQLIQYQNQQQQCNQTQFQQLQSLQKEQSSIKKNANQSMNTSCHRQKKIQNNYSYNNMLYIRNSCQSLAQNQTEKSKVQIQKNSNNNVNQESSINFPNLNSINQMDEYFQEQELNIEESNSNTTNNLDSLKSSKNGPVQITTQNNSYDKKVNNQNQEIDYEKLIQKMKIQQEQLQETIKINKLSNEERKNYQNLMMQNLELKNKVKSLENYTADLIQEGQRLNKGVQLFTLEKITIQEYLYDLQQQLPQNIWNHPVFQLLEQNIQKHVFDKKNLQGTKIQLNKGVRQEKGQWTYN